MNNFMVAAQLGGGVSLGLIYLVVIGLAFYFFIFRPNKKQKSQFDQMLESLKVGDDVVTRSGVKGKIVSVDDVYFTLETGNGAQITYILNALAYIVQPVEGVNSNETEVYAQEGTLDDDDQIVIEEEEYIDEEENENL